VLIGAGFTATLWLPLLMIALWAVEVLRRNVAVDGAGASLIFIAPILLSFSLACFASSMLVGRFGTRAGKGEAIGANLLVSLGALAMVTVSGERLDLALPALLVLSCCSLLAGWVGAALGIKRRPKNSAIRPARAP
jgi:hypothetical protein